MDVELKSYLDGMVETLSARIREVDQRAEQRHVLLEARGCACPKHLTACVATLSQGRIILAATTTRSAHGAGTVVSRR